MKVIIVKLIRLLALAFIPALIISSCGPGDINQGNVTGRTGIYFTSYPDEFKKGNTNATSPANGDWSGIYNDYTLYYFLL